MQKAHLTTATLLTTLLLTPPAHAEIIVGIDDPNNHGNTINTDITADYGEPILDITNLRPYQRLHIGHDKDANLIINNASTLTTDYTYLAHYSQSNSIVSIHDIGSNWTTSGFYIGRAGNATLNIKNGATINSSFANIALQDNSTGTVNIQDSGSNWTITGILNVGNKGQAALNIKNGATVNATRTVIGNLGHIKLQNGTLNTSSINTTSPQFLTGTGTINIAGEIYDKTITLQNQSDLKYATTLNGTNQNISLNLDLTQINDELGAGNSGTGILNIKNGIKLNSKNGYIGALQGSNGTVNIQDNSSNWTVGNITIGGRGQANLNIANGANVNSNSATIGKYSTSNGTVNIKDPGSNLTVNGRIMLGDRGNTTLNISNGATVNSNFRHSSPTQTLLTPR